MELSDDRDNVIQGLDEVEPCRMNCPQCNHSLPVSGSTGVKREIWYPDIDGHRCRNIRAMPFGMLADGDFD